MLLNDAAFCGRTRPAVKDEKLRSQYERSSERPRCLWLGLHAGGRWHYCWRRGRFFAPRRLLRHHAGRYDQLRLVERHRYARSNPGRGARQLRSGPDPGGGHAQRQHARQRLAELRAAALRRRLRRFAERAAFRPDRGRQYDALGEHHQFRHLDDGYGGHQFPVLRQLLCRGRYRSQLRDHAGDRRPGHDHLDRDARRLRVSGRRRAFFGRRGLFDAGRRRGGDQQHRGDLRAHRADRLRPTTAVRRQR